MPRGFLFRFALGPLPPPGGPTKTRRTVRAIVERNGLLLLVHSSQGDWKFPGGGVKPRELDEEALRREVQEETGYEITGRPRFAGRTVEQAEGREVPGSLFEMESLYFFASVAPRPGAPRLDAYERDLQFRPEWIAASDALAAHRALGARPDLRSLERENRVLEFLVSRFHQ